MVCIDWRRWNLCNGQPARWDGELSGQPREIQQCRHACKAWRRGNLPCWLLLWMYLVYCGFLSCIVETVNCNITTWLRLMKPGFIWFLLVYVLGFPHSLVVMDLVGWYQVIGSNDYFLDVEKLVFTILVSWLNTHCVCVTSCTFNVVLS